MSWLRNHRRSAWICGLTLLLPLYLLLQVFFGLWGKRAEYQSEIDYLVPRIARQQGLLDQQDALRESHARATGATGALLYPPSADRATVSADLQNSVRQMLAQSGLSVSNSQVLPDRQQGNFDYIGLRLAATGSLEALDAALVAIAAYQPVLIVETLDIRPARPKRNAPELQNVSASLQLFSLKVRQ